MAAVPPAAVTDALCTAVHRARAAAPDLRWSAPDRWHVTLAFLGPVPDERRGDLDARLARVARRHGPIAVETVGGGHFGDRVLWTAVRPGSAAVRPGALVALAAGVRRAVERAGAAAGADDRPLRAHLTLARVPDRGHRALGPLVELLRADVEPLPWTVDRLVLMRSIDSGPGAAPVYREQASWPLTGR
ncbi:RNA 2',3'-cyclic phosphodiesterase [Frankia sp. QA3]|uniref:RNA 2',3'-cyclic phosphodiesterase n=1 Tax=Frankia sp. QA3 TaxID=710111 RepID=UPI000269C7B8|nr:RNA 2',3'-cyclic phosphodiesterase [Frankia sp. QA3]EIV94965.1 2''-5'' RNA ligase [Frankia sp. QA3]